jgi:asparagine synthase (glutamine-hydrolysing)
VQPGRPKALLKAALGDLLPQEIYEQRKRTFTLPWEDWLRGALRPKLAESFENIAPALSGHLRSAGVQRVWDNFLDGRTTWSRPWSLYVLNEWCRQHLN